MIRLSIRQSGGANIVSIPKFILNALNLHVGSTLDLAIINHTIVLTPVKEKMTFLTFVFNSVRSCKTDSDYQQLIPGHFSEKIKEEC